MIKVSDKSKKYMRTASVSASIFRAASLMAGLISLFLMLVYPIEIGKIIYNTSTNWENNEKLEEYIIDVNTSSEDSIFSLLATEKTKEDIEDSINENSVKSVAIITNLKVVSVELVFITIVFVCYFAYKFFTKENISNPFTDKCMNLLNKVYIGIFIILIICALIGKDVIGILDTVITIYFLRYIIQKGIELTNKK